MKRISVGKVRRKAAAFGTSSQESALVNASRQTSADEGRSRPNVGKCRRKSALFNSGRSSVNEIQADYRRPTHVLEHKGFGSLRDVFLP